jgi:hypothetical protein
MYDISLSSGHVCYKNLPDPSSRTRALEFAQPLTEISIRNLPGGGG